MPKILPPSQSKLSKAIEKITNAEPIEKTGFIETKNDKTIYYQTKSFRLREVDSKNLSKITNEINKTNERKVYSDSEVIRGLINFIANNLETNIKKLSIYVKNSS